MKFFPVGSDVNVLIAESPLAGRTLALLVASTFKHELINSIDDFRNVRLTSMTNLNNTTVFLGGHLVTPEGTRLDLEFGHIQFTADEISFLNSSQDRVMEFLKEANDMLERLPEYIAALKEIFIKVKKVVADIAKEITPEAIRETAKLLEYGSSDRRKLLGVIGMITNTPPECDTFPYDKERLDNLRIELGDDKLEDLRSELKWHQDMVARSDESDPMFHRSKKMVGKLTEYIGLREQSERFLKSQETKS
jgi:hypothetical protein